jgi:hypothetical protein
MHEENKRQQLISEWCHRTRSRIEGHKTLRRVRPLFWGEHITLESSLTASQSAYSIETDEVPALQIQVEETELAQLVEDQEKLRQLMRIPEVREAIMYYTLNGYLKDF